MMTHRGAEQRPVRHHRRAEHPVSRGRQRRARDPAARRLARLVGRRVRRNLNALGAPGIRAIAFDLPGFGKSDATDDLSAGYKKKIILKFMDALKLERAALIAHSASGNAAVGIALDNPIAFRI